MNMDFDDFPSTQVCDRNEDFEPTQNTQGTGNDNKDDKKQVGVLIVNDTEYPVYTGMNTIGRHASNDIVLKDSTVSKHHAEIEGRRKVSFICDLKSCNKTVLNKEKLLPNRLFELSDGASLRIGSIIATYRKLSSLNESVFKTPVVSRCNYIIPSTPDSVLNTTDDDSSVVYGTQKDSEATSEFRQPSLPPQRLEGNQRNLNLEFFNDDSLLNSESGSTSIHKQETEAFLQPEKNDSSGIHDLETQEILLKRPETSNQKSPESADKILKTDTQSLIVNTNLPFENLNQDPKVGDENIFNRLTQKATLNSDEIQEATIQTFNTKSPGSHSKVHEEATQVFEFNSPSSHSKKLNKYIPRIEDSETVEAISEKTSVSTNFDNIHEKATQAFSLESPKTRKSVKFINLNKDDSIIADSDTDEEGLFEEATQACPVKSPIKTGNLGTTSRTEDSDIEERGVFEEATEKVSTNRKNDEEATQVCSVKSPIKAENLATTSRTEDSGTDEEGIFEGATQKVSINRKIDEEATQACPVKSPIKAENLGTASRIENLDTDRDGSFEGTTQKYIPSSSNKIDEEATQACPVKSPIKIGNLGTTSRTEESDTDEEGVFEGATQKVSTNRKIDEEATQACSVKSPIKAGNLGTTSRTEDSDTDEEGVFEGATQKVSTNRKIDEEATQACSVKSPVKNGNLETASRIENLDTDRDGSFEGPTQKYIPSSSNKIVEEATQACSVKSPIRTGNLGTASRIENLDTDRDGSFEGPTQKYIPSSSNKIQEEATQTFEVKVKSSILNSEVSKAGSNVIDSDTDEEGLFEKETQVVSPNKSSPKANLSSNKSIISTEGFSNIVDDISNIAESKSESKNSEMKKLSKPRIQKKKIAKSKTVEDFDTGDEDVFQKEEFNTKGLRRKISKIPIQKVPESKNSSAGFKTNSKVSTKADSKLVSKEDSETDDEGIFGKQVKEKRQSKTPIKKKKITESKTAEDSETVDEDVFQIEELNLNKYKGKNQLKTAGQKVKINKAEDSKPESENSKLESKISPKVESKNGEESKTDDEDLRQEQNSKFKKTLKSRMQSKSSIHKETKSKSPTQIEKMSPKPSTSKKNDSETDDDLFEPKSFIESSAPTCKKEMHSKENEIDHDAPTQLLSYPSPKRESIGLINASIEEIDYEMAPTQLLEDFKASEIKTPENRTSSESKTSDNKSNSGSKTNSGRKINTRANSKMNDTIEENLNKMFEGEDKEISEPSQILTQQLEDILEQTQVNEELVQTPSTSRTRNTGRNETSSEKKSPSLSETSSRSKNLPQVGKFNFKRKPKASSGLQVSISQKDKTCKSSDESDDDFVPFLTKNLSIKSNMNLKDIPSFKSGLKFSPRSPSPSTSSELSFNESLMASPSLVKNWKGRKSLQPNYLKSKKLKGLSSIGSLRMHEEVEKFASSKSIEVDSDDDSDFEELKRIADRVLKLDNVYVENKNASKSNVANVKKVSQEKLKVVESPSVFQVDADNCSPRMSKLNIIRSKRREKVGSSPQKNSPNKKSLKVDKTEDNYPLKKRPLQISDEELGSSTGKRLKVEDNEELENTKLYARQSASFGGSPKINKDSTIEKKMEEKGKESEKTNIIKGKEDLDSSSTGSAINDSMQKPKKRGRPAKIQKKNDQPKFDSSMNRKTTKRMAAGSSSSFTEDSGEVPTKKTDNLEVPSKAKKIKKAETVPNEVGNEKNEEKAPKAKRLNKRQVNKNKDIISNSSSSSSMVESSFNETTNAASENLKKPEPKKTSTRGRKKKQVSDTESMMADNNLTANSSIRGRKKKQVSDTESMMTDNNSTANSSTRGRKKKQVSDTESMMAGNNSTASSSMVSLNGTSGDGNSSAASTPTRSKRSRNISPLKHKVLFTGVSADKYQATLKKLGLTETKLDNKCTVLVTDKVRRTLKFLLATSQGIPIVSVNWLIDSEKKNSLQDLDTYIVKDPVAEAKFGFNLSDSLKKARDKKMLEGFTVVLTPNISAPSSSELKELVLASGGKAVFRPPAKWSENTVLVSDENDLNNAKKFMAKAPKAVTLHSTEFLLTGILKQTVDLKSYLLKIA